MIIGSKIDLKKGEKMDVQNSTKGAHGRLGFEKLEKRGEEKWIGQSSVSVGLREGEKASAK